MLGLKINVVQFLYGNCNHYFTCQVKQGMDRRGQAHTFIRFSSFASVCSCYLQTYTYRQYIYIYIMLAYSFLFVNAYIGIQHLNVQFIHKRNTFEAVRAKKKQKNLIQRKR